MSIERGRASVVAVEAPVFSEIPALACFPNLATQHSLVI